MRNNKGVSIVACIVIFFLVLILIACISIGSKVIKTIDEGVKSDGQIPDIENSTSNNWI